MRGKSWEHIINKKYGRLTVISLKKAGGRGKKTNAVCKCSCGNVKEFPANNLIRNAYVACGECLHGIPYKNYIGKKYGSLTVVDVEKNYAVCKCSCGNMKNFLLHQLEKGMYTYCGNCFHGVPCESFVGKKFGCLTVVAAKKPFYSRGLICTCKCNVCGMIKAYNLSYLKFHAPSKCCHRDYSNYIGKKFNHLTVIKTDKGAVICKCDCGNVVKLRMYQLIKRKTCGDCWNGVSWSIFNGKVFGYLTVKEIILERGKRFANCICKCGNTKKIPVYNLYANKNKTLSCGCLKRTIKTLKKISFGSLNIIKVSEHSLGGLRYVCECSCGNKVEVLESDLFSRKVTSCVECSIFQKT